MPPFELSKWYADCATEEGDALIIYCATLRFRGPTIHYSSLLLHRSGESPRSRFSLRRQPMPQIRQSAIEWTSNAWSVAGSWREPGRALRDVLFHSPAGSLEWTCVAPRSIAEVEVPGEGHFRGWGYVEHLHLSLPPWRLPISRLRWGRLINASDSLVWIDWEGGYTCRVAYCNGMAATAQTIGDREVVMVDPAVVLSLDTPVVLREGALGKTALAVIPHLNQIFPAAVLGMREQKWLSRAVVRRPGRPDSTGMAIHELVEWP